jgi:cytosine/adenosine deaminase-related metal-dependent hydrolase
MSDFTVHTDLLFDPKEKAFVKDVSITINPTTGLITKVYTRSQPLGNVIKPDIDLRGKVVCPGFVDAHTHIFLHAYS